jgi:hypothetical protein
MTKFRVSSFVALLAAAAAMGPTGAAAQESKPVYRCPGPPVLYTDSLTAQEARDRGCRTIEGAPLTIVQGRKPAPVASSSANSASGSATLRPGEARVDPAAQRARDTDSRRILEAELKREEEKLESLRKEFNNGEPERRGEERNFAKYQERVAELRAAIARKESDLVSIKRELGKLGQ